MSGALFCLADGQEETRWAHIEGSSVCVLVCVPVYELEEEKEKGKGGERQKVFWEVKCQTEMK